MTLSRLTRLENSHQAVQIMLQQLGESAVSQGYFRADSPDFSEIYATTWLDLRNRGYVSTWGSDPPFFQLTGFGWLEGTRQSGRYDEPEFQDRIVKLVTFLKGLVKGRHSPSYVDIFQVGAETGLPVGWIFNAVESRLIEAKTNRRGASWESNNTKNVLFVPIDFCMESLP